MHKLIGRIAFTSFIMGFVGTNSICAGSRATIGVGLLMPNTPADDFIAEHCGTSTSISKAFVVDLEFQNIWKKFGIIGISYGSNFGFWQLNAEGPDNKVTYRAIPIGILGKLDLQPLLMPISLGVKIGISSPYIMTSWDKGLGTNQVKSLNGFGVGLDAAIGIYYSVVPFIQVSSSVGYTTTSLFVKEETTGIIEQETLNDISIIGPKVMLGLSVKIR